MDYEKDNQEFKRAIEAEVNITSIHSLDRKKNKMLTGAGIITQHKKELLHFQAVFCTVML